VRYKIISKRHPETVLFNVTVASGTFEESKKRQLFLLAHSMHPDPVMQNHLMKFGIQDFQFVPDEVIEKAIIKPEKEVRNKFKSSK
jgi:hypothetical protein